LGHFAQVAVLPAFKRASDACELAALVSSEPEKLEALSARYHVTRTCGYEEYDELLRGGGIDAVYIALPNSMHCDFAVRALEAGVHVLVEKPMATSAEECERMIAAAVAADRACMVAYRLHFEPANLRTLEAVRRGEIGEPVFFDSAFSFQAEEGNIRLQKELGGGPLWDIGVYCINAARTLFESEPEEVFSMRAPGPDPRFEQVGGTFSCVMRFPRNRLATFAVSFAAAETSSFRIVGTKGDIRLDPAYGYSSELVQYVTVDGDTREHVFPKHDQIAPQLIYFAGCVRSGKVPEPSGREGLGDVRVVEALLASADSGQPVRLSEFHRNRRTGVHNEFRIPPHREPDVVKAQGPQAH
jgi:glucose-fructose oxidoreductase